MDKQMTNYVSINIATSSDTAEIRNFYTTYSDPDVRLRPDRIIDKTIDNGNFYIIRNSRKEIVGSAACFEFEDSGYYEIGAVRIILNGFHLQNVLNYCCITSHYLFNISRDSLINAAQADNAFSNYFCVVYDGSISDRNQRDVGFAKWTPPTALRIEREREIGPWASGKIELALPVRNLSESARRLWTLFHDRRITRPTPTREGINSINLIIDIPVLQSESMLAAVCDLAEEYPQR